MDSEMNGAGSYQVEISGWDSLEKFFVEKVLLRWDGCAEKQVRLQRELRQGSTVFVRLLRSSTNSGNFPLAYRADIAQPDGADDSASVRLVRMHPAAPFKHVSGKYVPAESLVA